MPFLYFVLTTVVVTIIVVGTGVVVVITELGTTVVGAVVDFITVVVVTFIVFVGFDVEESGTVVTIFLDMLVGEGVLVNIGEILFNIWEIVGVIVIVSGFTVIAFDESSEVSAILLVPLSLLFEAIFSRCSPVYIHDPENTLVNKNVVPKVFINTLLVFIYSKLYLKPYCNHTNIT